MYDVVVVGAGPAGNSAALNLALLGHTVAVLDERHDIGNKLCTGIVGPECVARFPPQSGHILHKALTATIISPDYFSYRIVRSHPQAFVLDRANYVASFANMAIENGADYILGNKVHEMDINEEMVSVHLDDKGTRRRYDAKIAIMATGFSSPLMDKIGLGRRSRDNDFLIGSQAEVETDSLEETEMYLGDKIAPGSFGWLVPLSKSKALLGIVSSSPIEGHMDTFLAKMIAEGKVNSVISQIKKWGIPIRPRPETYAKRVLAVGDAAGLVKPATGGGIYYSLLSGEMAANSASEAICSGNFSKRYLRRYEKRWKAEFGKELRIGYHARRLYEALEDAQRERLLRMCYEIELDLIKPGEFSYDWHGKVIMKAIRHPDLGPLIRSFGPSIASHITRLVGSKFMG